MVYIPGVRNSTSDAPSRYPSGSDTPHWMALPDAVSAPPPRIPITLMAGLSIDPADANSEMDVSTFCSALEMAIPISWQRLKEATTADIHFQQLIELIEEGFPPNQAQMPNHIRQFYIHRLHLYTVDRVVIFRDRVVIPPALRDDCLQFLHSAHQGTTMMQAKADASIFWPGIAADISNHRSSCTPCNVMSPSQASLPPTPNEALPEFVCRFFSPHLLGDCRSIFRLAHCRMVHQRRRRTHHRPAHDVCHLRHAGQHNDGRGPGVHRYLNQKVLF